MPPPKIHTYHCICTSLLLSSTHDLSTLPRRSTNTTLSLDSGIILPLPASPPTPHENGEAGEDEMPAEGYTVLLNLVPDRKISIIRREDGFEKRTLYRCSRCRLVVGYDLSSAIDGEAMDVDVDGGKGKGKGREGGEGEGEYSGKVIYILPAGLQSTEFMVESGNEGGKRIAEGMVGFEKAVAVFQ